jgi:hypothetical protein
MSMKKSATKPRILLVLVAFFLSSSSALIARAADSGWILSFGPSGIVGGWPISFLEYDFAKFYDNCLGCTFRAPSGTFLIWDLEASYQLGELYLGYFLVNVLIWMLIILAIFKIAKIIRKA